jgi:alkanesulfonate monooxygenase SsuD/methylene tetrahydromethanopterin reductase-like flavin-dependent oxidoreductase (luciferase family)
MTFDEITERVNAYKETQTELGIYHGGGQPIIREVAIGATKQEALEAARPSLLTKYESYASWGQTATKEQVSLADTFDDFIKDRFIIGDEYEVADELERYQESFGEGEFLVRIQWPGFEQAEVLDTIGRLGKIINRFS